MEGALASDDAGSPTVGGQPANAWRVVVLLFLASTLNYFDRALPAVIAQPIRLRFNLDDFQLGLIAAAFTLTYAVAGLPLGRLADRGSRKSVISVGMLAWSVVTGLSGLAWNFASFLWLRMAVGIGEASFGPAAMSMIGDLFPAHRRSRALGIYTLGLPVGLMLAFFTGGMIVRMFHSWRAAFFVATVPGLMLAFGLWLIREPVRGGAEPAPTPLTPIEHPIRRLLRIPTLWWITVSGIAWNVAAYAATSFLVLLLQRYNGLPLPRAGVDTGIIVGLTGLIGLTLGGWIADKLHQHSKRGRLLFGAASMAAACVATVAALLLGPEEAAAFTAVFSVGWLLQYQYCTCAYPAIQDVVEPRMRATAVALYFACLYLLGGAFGPVVVGLLSDHYAKAAMLAAGATALTTHFRGIGLHGAMYVIPAALGLTAAALLGASATFRADAEAMAE